MNTRRKQNDIRGRRARRVRATIAGTSRAPRLSVFRSNRAFYAQLIDDTLGRTLCAVSAGNVKGAKLTKTGIAEKMGALLAEAAKTAGITKVVFDRGRYPYHGRVKAFAEAARKGGITF